MIHREQRKEETIHDNPPSEDIRNDRNKVGSEKIYRKGMNLDEQEINKIEVHSTEYIDTESPGNSNITKTNDTNEFMNEEHVEQEKCMCCRTEEDDEESFIPCDDKEINVEGDSHIGDVKEEDDDEKADSFEHRSLDENQSMKPKTLNDTKADTHRSKENKYVQNDHWESLSLSQKETWQKLDNQPWDIENDKKCQRQSYGTPTNKQESNINDISVISTSQEIEWNNMCSQTLNPLLAESTDIVKNINSSAQPAQSATMSHTCIPNRETSTTSIEQINDESKKSNTDVNMNCSNHSDGNSENQKKKWKDAFIISESQELIWNNMDSQTLNPLFTGSEITAKAIDSSAQPEQSAPTSQIVTTKRETNIHAIELKDDEEMNSISVRNRKFHGQSNRNLIEQTVIKMEDDFTLSESQENVWNNTDSQTLQPIIEGSTSSNKIVDSSAQPEQSLTPSITCTPKRINNNAIYFVKNLSDSNKDKDKVSAPVINKNGPRPVTRLMKKYAENRIATPLKKPNQNTHGRAANSHSNKKSTPNKSKVNPFNETPKWKKSDKAQILTKIGKGDTKSAIDPTKVPLPKTPISTSLGESTHQ